MSGFGLSKKTAIHLKNNLNLNEDQEEVLVYSIDMILHNTITLISIILFAWLFNCLKSAILSTLVVAVLRALSGGAHSQSPINCTVLSVVLAVLIGKIAVVYGSQISQAQCMFLILFVAITAIIIVQKKAPVDSPAKPITSERERNTFRLLSLFAVTLLTTIQFILINANFTLFSSYSIAASIGLAWQTLSLTTVGHKFISKFDDLLNILIRR